LKAHFVLFFSSSHWLLATLLAGYAIGHMDVGSGEQGAWPPRIFMHGRNIVIRGLKVLFFGLFSVGPPERAK